MLLLCDTLIHHVLMLMRCLDVGVGVDVDVDVDLDADLGVDGVDVVARPADEQD